MSKTQSVSSWVILVAVILTGLVGCSSSDDGDVLDPAVEVTGSWQVVSMREECSDDDGLVVLPAFTSNGIEYDVYYEITANAFQGFVDLITVPGALPYDEGMYTCSDWTLPSAEAIDSDTVLDYDGTTIWFESLDGQLVVRMQYDHDPGCTDTYFCAEVTNGEIASASEDCDMLETEF